MLEHPILGQLGERAQTLVHDFAQRRSNKPFVMARHAIEDPATPEDQRDIARFLLRIHDLGRGGLGLNAGSAKLEEHVREHGLNPKDMRGDMDGEKEIWFYRIDPMRDQELRKDMSEGNWKVIQHRISETIERRMLWRGMLLRVFSSPPSYLIGQGHVDSLPFSTTKRKIPGKRIIFLKPQIDDVIYLHRPEFAGGEKQAAENLTQQLLHVDFAGL